jgi:tRNA A37 methylthiotransferase MiaB
VFGYSDEDGSGAAGFDGKLDADEIAERVARISELAEELMAQRAEDRIGERVEVLVESDTEELVGRALHQAPDTDGVTTLGPAAAGHSAPGAAAGPTRGQLVHAIVTGSEGVDLIARVDGAPW